MIHWGRGNEASDNIIIQCLRCAQNIIQSVGITSLWQYLSMLGMIACGYKRILNNIQSYGN